MRSLNFATNVCLAVLIEGSGFPSLERFAVAVNRQGWHMHNVKLSYDHVTVKRWLDGRTCQYPEVVAAVLSRAWGIPISPWVIWPQLREGADPVPAHLQAWVSTRTLEDLGVFLRSDMLTRREILTSAIGVATGTALVDPITRWLDTEAAGPAMHDERRAGLIGLSTVVGIEQATRQFAASDAEMGGGLSREAAVGQLKYAVDLARHASYSEALRKRLLAAIADLSGWVGWMSFDADMNGPAQKYLVYGLQAAHEAGDEQTRLRAAGILADMAIQMCSIGHPDTGLRLSELALSQLPTDRRRFNVVRAILWSVKANVLAAMGVTYLPEVRNAINLSFDLYAQGHDDEISPAVVDYYPYASDAELASNAAGCYGKLAEEDNRLAGEAETQALYSLDHRGDGFARSRVFDQIALSRARFLKAEPDQACHDGGTALDMAGSVASSERIKMRLRGLHADTERYRDQSSVRDFRDRLQFVIAG
jgi:hypothetical protein